MSLNILMVLDFCFLMFFWLYVCSLNVEIFEFEINCIVLVRYI